MTPPGPPRPAQPGRPRRRWPRRACAVLIRLYPAEFRQRFGAELRQVVETELGDRGGRQDLAHAIWLLTDLGINAIRERATGSPHADRRTLRRWSGAASAAGGAIFLSSMLTPLRGPLRAGVPLSITLMALGSAGLYDTLHGRDRRLEQLGVVLAGSGLTLGLIGMAGSALGIVDPNPLAPVLNTGEHLGLPLIGAGMTAWGVLSVRTAALGRLSFAPLLLGLCGLTGVAVIEPELFHALEQGPLPLLFSAAWILLGIALVTTPTSAPTTDIS